MQGVTFTGLTVIVLGRTQALSPPVKQCVPKLFSCALINIWSDLRSASTHNTAGSSALHGEYIFSRPLVSTIVVISLILTTMTMKYQWHLMSNIIINVL